MAICMITICMNDHQHVITDCMSSYLYVWQSEYVQSMYLIYKVFFFYHSKKNIFLLYYPSAQIKHIHDVYG